MKILIASLLMTLNAHATEIFLVNVKIGDRLFNDILILENNKGTLTVPGQFTTKILNYVSTPTTAAFNIDVLENGSPLKASYKLNSQDQFKTLNGVLLIEDESFPINGERIYAK